MASTGKVYLVGAGPGDPGLMTVKGLACIREADVIIYDFLASPTFLKHARENAEIIYVGKKGGDHTMTQDRINALLVEKARSHGSVVRLKGGDPYIFGRGGEEAEVLVAAGVPFEVVPGVTSAVAAPAYAGIPLTHREYTSTLAFVTGHEDPEKEESSIDWGALAKGMGTIVFFMGVKNLPRIAARLLEHGRPPDTPVALVRWGTTPKQKTVTGVLETVAETARQANIKAPAIIVVGEVVRLRERMKWFENRPLLGKRIIVTRARAQASDLVKQLSDLGAECIECPTIAIHPPDDPEPLKQAVDRLGAYDWLVFTSVNGVRFFFDALFEAGKDARALHHVKTAAIGPATAAKMREYGFLSDIVPETFRAESVVAAFRSEEMAGRRVLLPRASEARPVLPRELTAMGAEVDEIPAYRTRRDDSGADMVRQRLAEKTADMATFTSSSTVRNFRALLPADDAEAAALMEGVTVASIGPITADTAREIGFTVHITADAYTIPGLCDAIQAHYLGASG